MPINSLFNIPGETPEVAQTSKNKDWTGNFHSVVGCLGASNHTKEERQEHDFYATDPIAAEWLMQLEELNHNIWEPACVDCITEYFNGVQWKPISEYSAGESVLIFDGTYGLLQVPEKYHKYPCSDLMYYFHNRHLNMCVSSEHRVYYYHRRSGKLLWKSAKDIFDMYDRDHLGFRGKIPTSFAWHGNLNVDEWQLRLAVACNADGRTRTKHKQTYEVRLKKLRKIERMEWLLTSAKIPYKKYAFGDGYVGFNFVSPLGCKSFPYEWLNLTDGLKRVFIDELKYWDGCDHDGGMHQYFSSKKADVDLVQLIAHSIGYSTNISVDCRTETPNYRVQFLSNPNFALRKKENNLDMVTPSDGYKYCFTVSTGMLILRRNNKIFITGNCGQGHLAKVFEQHGYNVKSTDLIDRGFGTGGVDFLACEDKFDGDIVTNPPYKYAQEFIEHALALVNDGNKVCMFLKVQFLEGKGRRELFDKYPPKCVWVSSSRIKCGKNGNFAESMVAYAWYVWERGYHGDTILKWFN